jgi:flavin reductase (DIM6/NTAB) family NADH-FMN oxidoreductase RutF
MKRSFVPEDMATKDLHQLIIGCVAPRPIAFVSTRDEHGVLNLAPYSFFNAFSSNPPILVFSSNRRVTNNTTKDTLHNVMSTKEAVINAVSFDIVRQMSLSSAEFPSDVNEFEKTGLTPEDSAVIGVPGVMESPVNMECRVNEIIPLGEHGGAGHLIICEVVHMRIAERCFTEGKLDPHKLDLMARMGRNYYVRASGSAIMEIYQSVTEIPVGFDRLPHSIRHSSVLTGNQIAVLASFTALPNDQEIEAWKKSDVQAYETLTAEAIHLQAAALIQSGQGREALNLLMWHDRNTGL